MKKLLAVLLICVAGPAWAAMSLDKMIVHMDAIPNAREDIVVYNPDQETLYVQTEVFRVDNPGTENEKLVPVVNPEDFKLLISPSKAVIPAGAQKRFRLMNVESGIERERVYRVTFKPVVGEITTEASGLKVLVAFQALIFVQPVGGTYALQLEHSGDQINLKNNGAVNAEIIGVQHCVSEQQCSPVELAGRLYPGAEKRVPLDKKGGYLAVRAFDGDKSETVKLPL
ncbi:fimbrial biogenesis chaperone [Microbulbifer agarilyticus]|uniref:fimbrial biogenesis chaperone n=1 Tax=Microbulbifer agarilyticus TaxID=260552 RepID=UPI001CD4DD01|nr:hypothetical protein [Microbulbifer agarilyticus]MCA0899310.1 hypothetical protein [Microbulbifer agarilyticus]